MLPFPSNLPLPKISLKFVILGLKQSPLPSRRHPERSEGSPYLPLLVPVVACSIRCLFRCCLFRCSAFACSAVASLPPPGLKQSPLPSRCHPERSEGSPHLPLFVLRSGSGMTSKAVAILLPFRRLRGDRRGPPPRPFQRSRLDWDRACRAPSARGWCDARGAWPCGRCARPRGSCSRSR
jgi:hypothetical protein